MKWFLTPLLVLALSTLFLPACGGRSQLGPETARQYRELFRTQGNSRPRAPLAKLSARDAKLIMQNHNAVYSGGTKTSRRGARRGMSLQPSNLAIGGREGGKGDTGVQLRAR